MNLVLVVLATTGALFWLAVIVAWVVALVRIFIDWLLLRKIKLERRLRTQGEKL